jgi:hypothetical protein
VFIWKNIRLDFSGSAKCTDHLSKAKYVVNFSQKLDFSQTDLVFICKKFSFSQICWLSSENIATESRKSYIFG